MEILCTMTVLRRSTLIFFIYLSLLFVRIFPFNYYAVTLTEKSSFPSFLFCVHPLSPLSSRARSSFGLPIHFPRTTKQLLLLSLLLFWEMYIEIKRERTLVKKKKKWFVRLPFSVSRGRGYLYLVADICMPSCPPPGPYTLASQRASVSRIKI